MNRIRRLPEMAIIGGSGLYDLRFLDDVERLSISTPFGNPSSDIVIGTLAGRRVAFLARHGERHGLSPSEVPYRANILALRRLGVRNVVAVNAVGSLAEKYAPGDIVVPDQVVDRTKGLRPGTFFGNGIVAHVAFADPFCDRLRGAIVAAAGAVDEAVAHDGGTYCCIEGPQFSTRAEADLHRSWRLGIVGMTAVPEARLAREAELCYASLALVTDYDCWHDSHEVVSADLVADVMRRNIALAQRVIATLLHSLDGTRDCPCRHALAGAVMTDPSAIPTEALERVAPLLDERLPTQPVVEQSSGG